MLSARRARADVISQNKDLARKTLDALAVARSRLLKRLDLVLAEIEAERKAGKPISLGRLAEKGRLEKLNAEIRLEMQKVALELDLVVSKSQREAIVKAIADAKIGDPLAGSLVGFDRQALNALVGNVFGDRRTPIKRLFERVGEQASIGIYNALVTGVATGQSNEAIARTIRGEFTTTFSRAYTIARTETNNVYREATRATIEANPAGFKGYIWVSARDLTTCATCWAMHGRVFQVKTKFRTHPNCRCVLQPYTGKNGIPTGETEFAGLTEAQQRAIIGPNRLDLYRQGYRLGDFVKFRKTEFGMTPTLLPIDKVIANGPAGKATPKPKPKPKPKPRPTATPKPKPVAPVAPVAPTPTPTPAGKPTRENPALGIPAFKTTTEAENYLESRFKDLVVDFKGFDTDLLPAIVGEFTRLADEWPDVAGRLRYLGTYANKTKPVTIQFRSGIQEKHFPTGPKRRSYNMTLGRTVNGHTDGIRLALNSSADKMGNASAWRRLRATDAGNGWCASPAVEGTLTHEFGHCVDYYLKEKLATHSVTEYDAGLVAKFYRRFRLLVRSSRAVSEYSLKNDAEAFAEMFHFREKRPRSEWPDNVKAFDQFLTEFRKLKLVEPAKVKPIASAPNSSKALIDVTKIWNKLGLR